MRLFRSESEKTGPIHVELTSRFRRLQVAFSFIHTILLYKTLLLWNTLQTGPVISITFDELLRNQTQCSLHTTRDAHAQTYIGIHTGSVRYACGG